MLQAGSATKRPETTYTRRNKQSKEEPLQASSYPFSPTLGAKKVCEGNFAQKVMEVLQPVPGKAPLIDSASDSSSEDSSEYGKRTCVRNVHELLESGVSSRLYDELDYLVSGLEGLSTDTKPRTASARQQYLFDIGKKLLVDISPMQASRLRSSGFIERIICKLSTANDLDEYSNRFMAVILKLLCDDVRRIDHFIKVPMGIKLAKWLIMKDEEIIPPGTSPSRSWTLFELPTIKTVSGFA